MTQSKQLFGMGGQIIYKIIPDSLEATLKWSNGSDIIATHKTWDKVCNRWHYADAYTCEAFIVSMFEEIDRENNWENQHYQ